MRRRLILLAVLPALFAVGCASTPKSGEIGVVRNGRAVLWPPDWFDNHNIRGTVDNGAGNTWVGLGSDVHYYPVRDQQRFFRLASCFNKDGEEETCDGADAKAITVPTADGVDATISGTFYFNTAFDNSAEGKALVKSFDTQFSTRTFGGLHPYEGNDGWSNFLTQIVEPISESNMRTIVSGIQCGELVSSCALVQNNGQQDAQRVKGLATGKANQANVLRIQKEINDGLARDLEQTLGKDYFTNVRFQLAKVTLPPRIQGGIDRAQAAFARVSEAQAGVAKAKADAAANRARQKGYESCPACAQIDTLAAIPKNVTTFAPGGSFAVTGK